MKKSKSNIRKLAADAAFIAASSVVNRCFDRKESAMVDRDIDVEKLNRRLTMVSLVYHAIGIFYNE